MSAFRTHPKMAAGENKGPGGACAHAPSERREFDAGWLPDDGEWSGSFEGLFRRARWEERPEGIVLVAPSNYDLCRMRRFRMRLERFWHKPVVGYEVDPRLAETEGANVAPLRTRAWDSEPRQAPLTLPPRPAGAPRPRPEVPPFVSSPAFEVPLTLTRRWAQAVRGPGALWVHGPSGSGKSHLLRQLFAWVPEERRITSVTVSSLLQEWRQALESRQTLAFVRKYRRDTDLLVLENVDELQNKKATQQELRYIVQALFEREVWVAVSSQSNPLQLKGILDEALWSRLCSGLVLPMPAPDATFRRALWKELCVRHELGELAEDLVLLERMLSFEPATAGLAVSLYVNALCRWSVKGSLSEEDFRDLGRVYGAKAVPENETPRSPEELLHRICELCGVSAAAIRGSGRGQAVTLARRFAYLALSVKGGLTNGAIARFLGRDPSTVSFGLKSIHEDVERNGRIGRQWQWILSKL